MHLNPYLIFSGQCREAFQFYEQCLGGRIVAMISHQDTPAAAHVSDDWGDLIMHARLVIGDAVLMGSDSPPEHFKPMEGMYVSLQLTEVAEAERIFHALAEGAEIRMPLQETFWAARFAMLVDRFGTPWMINCEMSA